MVYIRTRAGSGTGHPYPQTIIPSGRFDAASVNFSDQPVPLRLKPQRQFPFLARHPWVHAHSLAEDGRELPCGQVVDLLDHDGSWIARGVINPSSRLRIRLHVFEPTVAIDRDLWVQRIDAAIARRRLCPPPDASGSTPSSLAADGEVASLDGAERLIFSESDLLSGLIVDRYADCLSVQFTSGGLMRWADSILEYLVQATSCRAMMVRLDAKTAKYEGVEAVGRCHFGQLDDVVHYQLNGLQLAVDLRGGQKTGGYLDQRLNHVAAGKYMAGRRVLDVCCYSGGFGLVAARLGAKSVLGIDSSETAIAAARESAQRNEIESTEFRVADCFDETKRLVDAGEQFDAVVLDPPRFAGSRHQIDTALRAYGRLNSAAVQLLPPGGILVTCSCSGRVSRSDFLNMLLDVGRRRRRDLIVLENRGPAPDHPVAIACPESDYLKCVIAQAG